MLAKASHSHSSFGSRVIKEIACSLKFLRRSFSYIDRLYIPRRAIAPSRSIPQRSDHLESGSPRNNQSPSDNFFTRRVKSATFLIKIGRRPSKPSSKLPVTKRRPCITVTSLPWTTFSCAPSNLRSHGLA